MLSPGALSEAHKSALAHLDLVREVGEKDEGQHGVAPSSGGVHAAAAKSKKRHKATGSHAIKALSPSPTSGPSAKGGGIAERRVRFP